MPICGDQDGSEPPLILTCPDFVNLPDVQIFRVPGAGPVDLRFDFVFREALFNNELGFYRADNLVGHIDGLNPGDPGYLAKALNRAVVVFPSGSTAFTADVIKTVQGGDALVFFLIQNSRLATLRTNNPTNDISKLPLAFFSLDILNPDKFDHFVGFNNLKTETTQFGFEDLTGGGDKDYDDVVYNLPALEPSPTLKDSDGDGLPDQWEVNGLQGVDLKEIGADPNTKDIFVEVDWFDADTHNHRPDDTAISTVVAAFKRRGINLHVDAGPDSIDYVTGKPWGKHGRGNKVTETSTILGRIISPTQYDWAAFDAIKAVHFGDKEPARRRIFHYAVFAHQIDSTGEIVGVSRGIPSSDFIVSLGAWETNPSVPPDRLSHVRSGSFMHELGHNLGLCHGGPRLALEKELSGEELAEECAQQFKPNYLSVMNYSFIEGLSVEGLAPVFDYSRFDLPDLNEQHLNETVGVNGGPALVAYSTQWYCKRPIIGEFIKEEGEATGPLNWDCDLLGLTGATDLATDINKDEKKELLRGYEDWGSLIFSFPGGWIGAFGVLPQLPTVTEAEQYTPEVSRLVHQLEVAIDIKPGETPNSINLGSRGVIPIAILTTAIFDATTVDPLSVRFGRTGAAEVHQRGHIEDVDGDGRADLVLHISVAETGIIAGDTMACLVGELTSRQQIAGCDAIRVVPKP